MLQGRVGLVPGLLTFVSCDDSLHATFMMPVIEDKCSTYVINLPSSKVLLAFRRAANLQEDMQTNSGLNLV